MNLSIESFLKINFKEISTVELTKLVRIYFTDGDGRMMGLKQSLDIAKAMKRISIKSKETTQNS